MKRLALLLFSFILVLVLSIPLFGESGGGSQKKKKAVPPFVEANVPEGKALVYIYRTTDFGVQLIALILAKDGPISVLPMGTYCVYVADPGIIKLWLSSISSAEIKAEVVTGQVYYVKGSFGPNALGVQHPTLKAMPREKALKEIAECGPAGEDAP
jgi:hypothetical protein